MSAKRLDPKSPTVCLPPIKLPLTLMVAVEKAAAKSKVSVSKAVRRALAKEYAPEHESAAA